MNTNANMVKKELWNNLESASGEMITIDRRVISYWLDKLEKDQFDSGFDCGYGLQITNLYERDLIIDALLDDLKVFIGDEKIENILDNATKMAKLKTTEEVRKSEW